LGNELGEKSATIFRMKNIISGLLKKRKELLHDLAECEAALVKARQTLQSLEDTVRLYKPDLILPTLAPTRKRYKRSEYFRAGELTPMIKDFLREYEGSKPPSTMDIVEAVATQKQIDYQSLEYANQQTFYKCVRKSLYAGKGNGWLVEVFRERRIIHWQLAKLTD